MLESFSNEQLGLAGGVALLGLTVFAVERDVPGMVGRGVMSLARRAGWDHWLRKQQPGVWLGPVFLSDQARVRHSHIVGSPGSGKTEATKSLIFEDILRGRGAFIIDAKGDRELYDEVRAYCRLVGREQDLRLLSATHPEESSVWNPCGLGDASQLQSKFLNANVYSEPFYAKACEFGLIQAFNQLVRSRPRGFGLSDLVRELRIIAEKEKSETLEGLFYDFGNLASGEWSEVLGCRPEKTRGREFSLLDVVQKNQILFVDLPTEGRSIQSSRLGRLLTQELILISGLRKNFPVLNRSGVFSVYIDEFDAFATDSFITFLNKGRSSNFMIHIAHQTLSDLRKVSQEFAGQVMGNCNVHLIFRQDDPDDAELWSRFIGTHQVTKRTYQTQDGSRTGMSSNREVQEFLVSPDQIKNLRVGECIVSAKTLRTHRIVRLPLPPRYAEAAPASEDVVLDGKVRSLDTNDPTLKPTLSPENFELSSAPPPQADKWSAFQPDHFVEPRKDPS